jgi:hypothetical protein
MQKVGDRTYKIGPHTFEIGKCSNARSHKKADMQHILDLLGVKYLKSDKNGVLCTKIEDHIRHHYKAPAAPAVQAPAVQAPAAPAAQAQQTRLTAQGLFFKGKLYPLTNCAVFAKNRAVSKKDLEKLCTKFGVSPKGTKETICAALRAKSLQSAVAVPVAIAAAAAPPAVVVPAAVAVVAQQQQLVYDRATNSVKIGAHRFTLGKCDAARFYKKDDLKAMAKKLKIPVASKDTNKVICDKIHAVVIVAARQKAVGAAAASPPRTSPAAAAAASPRRSPPAAPVAAPKPLQTMNMEEIRASIRKCLNL